MEGGYETTRSPKIISNTIKWLKQSRTIISLLSKGYQSGATLVYKLTDQHILIDKPKDWPGTKMRVRVVFRSETKVWMHFISTVLATSKNGLKCTRPKELFMLQRRNHYRVTLPRNSVASFTCDHALYKLGCKDLSAGGTLLVSKKHPGIGDVTRIKNIILTIPSEDTVPDVTNGILTLYIEEGDILRQTIQSAPIKLFCVGVRFYCSATEEEKILRYVRQRELEVLRKGIAD